MCVANQRQGIKKGIMELADLIVINKVTTVQRAADAIHDSKNASR